ncbi:MAG: alcohol dehydrogenase catalytic domain-containing protein [Chitinophagaceae bacterium]|nr:alcohol dehydrogenase catalytic domain-containing protein [Chitinophagaceae bacterium]
MQALFYPAFGKLEISEHPVPGIKNDEVLLKVAACGICGSELETFARQSERRTPPLIMGHEFSGVIEETGADVSDFQKGEQVVSNSIVSCGHCSYCMSGLTNLCPNRQIFGMHRNGAFAEYVNVPARSLMHKPGNVSFQAASLAEPLGNGVHMVALTRHLPLKNVLIIGAGPIGLMAQLAFQALREVRVMVSDLKEERLEVARKLGASRVINSAKENLETAIGEAASGEGLDLVIDAVGMEATSRQGLQLLRNGGALVLIGLHQNAKPFQSYDIILTQKQVMGTYAATREDMQTALELMSSGKADVSSWVSYYPLRDGVKAFKDMLTPEGSRVKAVITMD